MKIEFVGAAKTVTGSSYIVKNDNFTIMIDCGMFQGRRELKERNYLHLIYAPQEIDALLVTHAHIDHSGLIPKLAKEGFNKPIFATSATADLLRIMLPDSAHIQEMDAEFFTKRNKKLGREAVEPLYVQADAEEACKYLNAKDYGEIFDVVPGVKARFRDAGHILGSAMIELWVEENGTTKKIVFSGDLGPRDQAIIKNAEHIEDADFLLVESTYGDRIHKSKGDTYAEFKNVINEAHNKKGNIVIPSFAVERTQEIIHTLSDLLKNGEIPLVPVYIDSPLAISATEIFRKHVECYDDDMKARILRGEDPLNFPSLTYTKTTAESKELNKKAKGAIIISASGMCTAGRIKYHLQNNLYKKEASVVFVGYQAEGTLGRSLVEGAKRVKLYGEEVSVNAKIYTLGGFSGHADKDGLLEWVSKFKNKNMKVFVVHGEEKSSSNLASLISENFGFKTTVPSWGDIVDLNTFETTRMSYGVVPENIRTIDDDVEQIDVLVEAFIAKYQKAKNDKNMALMDRVGNDIEDLKAMIKRVSEKL